MGGAVFISYRRQKGAELAHLVDSELRSRGLPTFIDVAKPEPGRFWRQIQAAIRSCRAFVLVCTSETFDATDGEDWVLREINEALAHGRRIVPVFSRTFKRPATVPEAVAQALECNGVSMDTQFPNAVFDRLRELVGGAPRWSGRKIALGAGGLALVAALVTIAAAKPDRPGSAPTPAPAPPVLGRILRHEVFGMQQQYFESLAGPAMNVVDGRRSYRIDGCDVQTTLDGSGAVKSIRLALSDHCGFDSKEFFWNYTLPPLGKLTFGQFVGAFGEGKFVAQCLAMCGNGAASEFSFFHEGSHADDFLNVLAGSSNDAAESIAPLQQLGQDIERFEGSAYVEDARFNCSRKYDVRALALLRDLRVRFIEIGKEMNPPELERCK